MTKKYGFLSWILNLVWKKKKKKKILTKEYIKQSQNAERDGNSQLGIHSETEH